MEKLIPKTIEQKIRSYVNHQTKANELEEEIRHWLYKNNYANSLVDMLIDVGLSGDSDGLINFLNGEPDEYGNNVFEFYQDNSLIDEYDYGL